MRRNYWIAGFIGFVLVAITFLSVIFKSKSSTASIGILFIPIYGSLGALAAMALYFVAETIKETIAKNIKPPRIAISAVIVLLFSCLIYAWQIREISLAELKNPKTSPEEIRKINERFIPFRRLDIQYATARNSKTPLDMLKKLVDGGNLYIQSLVASNFATPVELLEQIGKGPLSYENMSGLAVNPKTPVHIMERLIDVSEKDFKSPTEYKLYQSYVLGGLARNRSLPKNLYQKLVDWKNPEHFLKVGVIYSQQATCPVLKKYLSDENPTIVSTANGVATRLNCAK